jgi:hypothetical protein
MIVMGESGDAGLPKKSRSVPTLLFNPFHYLAGGPALGLGLAAIVVAGLICALGQTHFDGVLDLHSNLGLQTGRTHCPLWVYLAEGLIDWLALGVPLLIAGKLLSRSRGLRALDVFGTQALARAPFLISALVVLLPGFRRSVTAMVTTMNPAALTGNLPDFLAFLIALIVVILMTVWAVALMYRAYAVSCNIKGARAVVSFIIVLLAGEALSKIAIGLLLSRLWVP